MDLSLLSGALIVVFAGLFLGSGGWPIKLMKRAKYEHFGFVSILASAFIGPWMVTLLFCPNAMQAYKSVDTAVFIKANLFSMAWGVANILCMKSLMRIGFCLTGGIITGIGVSIGVTLPMVFKGSGLFRNAPAPTSPAGLIVLGGVIMMMLGVIASLLAGVGRDKMLQKAQKISRNFIVSLLMVVLGGILSAGVSFVFIYSQEPIVAAMKSYGAGEIPANFAVWAAGLVAGGLINLIYTAWLMTKNKSWNILCSLKDSGLSIIMGINIMLAIALTGKGMLMLGAFGASVGLGIQQAMQMIGSQSVGFIGGEWHGIYGKPRNQMYASIALLIFAAIIMACGNGCI
ncbi:MAG: hypothetical protein A2Y12_12015 [Planctomycetes bacterium GWF2_42_9]|nr:MAG: hypothetical protein A2Y12_12015 [Planctomycetes bacterium GWF2_42_9]